MIIIQAAIILAVLAALYWAAKPLNTNHAEKDEATSRGGVLMEEPMSITNERLDEIQGWVDRTTKGWWYFEQEYDEDSPYGLFSVREENGLLRHTPVAEGIDRRCDAEFIAHAREDIPALLAEVHRLRALTTITKDRVRAAGREFWLSGAKDRAWAEAAWDDMGGGEPCAERALVEIAAERALEAALKETK